MRLGIWLTALNLAALAVVIPLCLTDCLPQPAASQACHQEEHSQQPQSEFCVDCLAGEFVKPKTLDSVTALQFTLPPTSEPAPAPRLDSDSLRAFGPTPLAGVWTPPLVLRL